jgi:DNA-binding CsgD family transcriptional regulator
MRLSPRDFDALQKAILELYDPRDVDEFRAAAPQVLLRVIPSEGFVLMDFDVDVTAGRLQLKSTWDTSERLTPEVAKRVERVGWEHPFTQHVMKTGDPSALMFSDFFTLRQFRGTELYAEVYRHFGVERVMGALLLRGPNAGTTINTVRCARDRDFSERDRLMLNLLRPHFALARQNAERVSARRGENTAMLESFGLTPREGQVAHWIARGKTNLEISIILQTRPRTVEKHVEAILSKLGVENRTAAALVLARADTE